MNDQRPDESGQAADLSFWKKSMKESPETDLLFSILTLQRAVERQNGRLLSVTVDSNAWARIQQECYRMFGHAPEYDCVWHGIKIRPQPDKDEPHR